MFVCRLCGEDIFKDVKINKRGEYVKTQLKKFHKECLDTEFKFTPSVCYTCFENKYGKVKRSLNSIQRAFLYDVDILEIKGITNNGYSLEKSIKMHGLEEGTKKFNDYCKRQSYTNSLEYKQIAYGITPEEFDLYNKSRAVTLENCIDRHGLEEGTKKFNDYCKRQSYTNSLEYNIEKYGLEEGTKKYNNINKLKKHTLENCIDRHGLEEGTKKFNSFIHKKYAFYSKISQELFWNIYNELPKELQEKCYFAELNNEFGKFDTVNKTYYKYDFVIVDLNICIEFNGDDWHANPIKYDKTDFVKIKGSGFKATHIWEADKIKQDVLVSQNFKYFIVWESDYKKDKVSIKDNFIKIIKKEYDEQNKINK